MPVMAGLKLAWPRRSKGNVRMIKGRKVPGMNDWIPISTEDGVHHGRYAVMDGWLYLRFKAKQEKMVAPSSTMPPADGAKADQELAKLTLAKLANADRG